MKNILWFRRDLRVDDNPILSHGGEVMPIFIFDTNILQNLKPNDVRVSFIFDAVCKLKADLMHIGLDLKIFFGTPQAVFQHILQKNFTSVIASGDYDAYAKERDLQISRLIDFRYKQGTYLFRPHEVCKDDGSPYVVFKPYYTKARKILEQKLTKSQVASHTKTTCEYGTIAKITDAVCEELPLLLESIGFVKERHVSLDSHATLESFLEKIDGYGQGRDYLDRSATSHLSLYLRFGTVSVQEVARRVLSLRQKHDVEPYLRELIFRDYYAYLLFHFPYAQTQNFKGQFCGELNERYLEAFCSARTGYPIVDAAITELLQTGYMHNRARMFCASFFTKHLLLPWQLGESFFAKHLLDYDAASNVFSWQWSASTGVDAQPYFRIFNPYAQGEKFDKDAKYIKKYLPDFVHVNPKELHSQATNLCQYSTNYPPPIVQHQEARERAIQTYKERA